MEENIKILEEIKNMFIHLKSYGWINDIKRDIDTDKAIKSIENLITRYKQLEEENKSKQKAYDDCYCEYKHYKQFDSIPKSKVKDKIKELDERIKNPERNSYWASYTVSECIGIRRILQDLLERSREDE